MFVDEARIYVKGGDGGKGCQSFAKTTKKAFEVLMVVMEDREAM